MSFSLLLFFSLATATGSMAQKLGDYKASVTARNMPVPQVLQEIQIQTGLVFAYFKDDLNGLPPVSLAMKDASVETILRRILPSNTVVPHLSGNQVILSKPETRKTAAAKTGIIKGLVTDAMNREVLPSATVAIKNKGWSVLTDKDGNYLLHQLPAGTYDLEVSYLGYTPSLKKVTLQGGQTITLNVALLAKTHALNGVTITGIRRGEATALNNMRNAENIKYVLSKEQIEKFPDNTVSESLQRVPGVAVGYSYGVARDVIIRGLDPTRNSLQFNGNKAPATETQTRTTDLNGVLSNTVESIEIIKTLTPDRDADATGGIVNIITKSAQDPYAVFSGKALVGYNGLTRKPNYDLSAVYGQKKKKFGYLFGASYFASTRGQDRIDISYEDYEIGGSEKRKPENVTYEAFTIDRENLGLTLDLNYDAGKNTNLYLRSSYNKYYEFQYSGSIGNSLGSYNSENAISNITIYREGRWRDYNRDIFNVNAGGKSLAGGINLDYDLNFNKGIYDQPKYWNASFNLGGQSATLDVSNPSRPVLNFNDKAAYELNNYTTRSYINRHEQVNDIDGQGTFNAKKVFKTGATQTAFIKAGARYRYKKNDRFRNYFNHVLNSGEPAFRLSDYTADYRRKDFFNDVVDFYGFPDTKKMEQNYQRETSKYEDDITYIRQNTDPDSYEGTEDLLAGYLMGAFNSRKWEITTGVRFERTSFDYKGNQVLLDEAGKYISTTKIDHGGNFSGFYPSLNVKYKLSQQTNIRAAVTRSLSRPNYYDLVPWQEIERRRKRINQGNPNLKEENATNFDLLFEHYFSSIGLLSGGVFHKEVRDVLFSYSYLQSGGEFDQYRINTVSNGTKGHVTGIELAWQQQFTFLPGWLNGFGVYANYSYIRSKLTIPFMETARDIALPDMRPHVGNLSLTYEKFGFSGRISTYFFATYLREVGDEERFDIYEKGRMQLDFSASQRITRRLKAVLNISNITKAQRSDYMENKTTPLNTYTDGMWGSAGVSFRL